MNDFCANCDKELPTGQRSDSKFCSENCKIEYHNEMRKADRAEKRAIEAINQLRAILESTGEKTARARVKIANIELHAKITTMDLIWKCTNCGQLMFESPTYKTTCDFCGNKKFSFTVPKK